MGIGRGPRISRRHHRQERPHRAQRSHRAFPRGDRPGRRPVDGARRHRRCPQERRDSGREGDRARQLMGRANQGTRRELSRVPCVSKRANPSQKPGLSLMLPGGLLQQPASVPFRKFDEEVCTLRGLGLTPPPTPFPSPWIAPRRGYPPRSCRRHSRPWRRTTPHPQRWGPSRLQDLTPPPAHSLESSHKPGEALLFRLWSVRGGGGGRPRPFGMLPARWPSSAACYGWASAPTSTSPLCTPSMKSRAKTMKKGATAMIML